eukprot:3702445-Amphidinium_carterae.1
MCSRGRLLGVEENTSAALATQYCTTLSVPSGIIPYSRSIGFATKTKVLLAKMLVQHRRVACPMPT